MSIRTVHRFSGVVVLFCIVLFSSATIISELFGSFSTITKVKNLIVSPGLWLLVPAMILTNISGKYLSGKRSNAILKRKQKRALIAALNGLLVLVPCALLLRYLAQSNNFGGGFYTIQLVEIVAGAANFVLLSLNSRDGLMLVRRNNK